MVKRAKRVVAKKTVAKKKTAKKPPAKTTATKAGMMLLVGTRKGAFILSSDATRRKWATNGPHFLGNIVYHMVLDPRDGKTLLAAAKAGHLGPTLYRSTNFGKSWKEAERPPAFPKAADGKGRAVDHTFWLTPGHASEK